MSMGIGIGIGLPFARREGVGGAVRVTPGATDVSYVVVPAPLGLANVVRWQRNVGGVGSGDVGGAHPNWRITGEGLLSSPYADPSAAWAVTFVDDIGAREIVGNNGSKYFLSFHGIGASGALNSESITLDGRAIDFSTAQSGSRLVVRSSVTASNGTDSISLDLTTTVDTTGVTYYVNSISKSAGIQFVYLGMLIGSGSYDEADVQLTDGGPWLCLPPLGTSQDVFGRIFAQVVPKGLRLRDTSTGRSVSLSGAAVAALANYVQTELLRDTTSTDRLKGYFGRFSDVTALVGASWTTSFGVVATGSQLVAANQFTNGDFATGDLTGWTKAVGATNPTVVAGAMRQVREAAANHRMRQTASFAASLSDVWAYRVDQKALSGGTTPWARVSTANTLTTVAAMVDKQLTSPGRWLFIFVPTVTTMYAGIEHSLGAVADTLDTDNYFLGKLN